MTLPMQSTSIALYIIQIGSNKTEMKFTPRIQSREYILHVGLLEGGFSLDLMLILKILIIFAIVREEGRTCITSVCL